MEKCCRWNTSPLIGHLHLWPSGSEKSETASDGAREYTMTSYRDAEDADVEPNNIQIETRSVNKKDEIVVQMAPNGGFAGKFELKK